MSAQHAGETSRAGAQATRWPWRCPVGSEAAAGTAGAAAAQRGSGGRDEQLGNMTTCHELIC
eukprot:15300567-Alexandrium_andersonii.AAC.1